MSGTADMTFRGIRECVGAVHPLHVVGVYCGTSITRVSVGIVNVFLVCMKEVLYDTNDTVRTTAQGRRFI